LSAGFVDDAKAWAEAHTIQEDEQGHIAQALARAHSLRAVETEKLQAILAPESQHRSALADLAGTITCLGDIEGWWKFPEATIELSVKNGQITGAGEGQSIAGTVKHQLSASQQNGIWRLEKRSHTLKTTLSEVRVALMVLWGSCQMERAPLCWSTNQATRLQRTECGKQLRPSPVTKA